jgi:hypothetical protein
MEREKGKRPRRRSSSSFGGRGEGREGGREGGKKK